MPTINASGLALIKSFEGCELTAYADATGIPTIGWGHTGSDVKLGQTITQQHADALLASDLLVFENGVNNLVARNISPNQFAALVSFAYNLGLAALGGSTLMRDVNAGNFAAAADQFGEWISAGGTVLEGLVRRRAAERTLFLKP